jgi:hypothetical protein
MAVAHVPKYKNTHAVGHSAEEDYRIGVKHGVVGCGRKFTDKKYGMEWFTIVEDMPAGIDMLVYNGPVETYVEGLNPWGTSGQVWYSYKVPHHHLLGPVTRVLAAAGVPSSLLLSLRQGRLVKDCPEIHRLIAYAKEHLTSTDACSCWGCTWQREGASGGAGA